VFQIAQKHIGGAQFADLLDRQKAPAFQLVEHFHRGAFAQRLVPAAANQLEHLADEFDFADAARAELDIVGHVAAGDFAADLRVQFAHRLENAVIEVFAVNKGRDHLHQPGLIASERPALDPGVTLPFAPLREQVVFQRGKARHQRAGIAKGAQAHVDAEHETVAGLLGQKPDQLAADAGEVIVVVDFGRAAGFAVFGVDKDQVDVGRNIEFASAELAHAYHDQLLHFTAVAADRLAVAGLRLHGPGERGGDGRLGEIADHGHRLGQIA